MSRLLRVELRRYRARRVTLWVLIGVVAVAALSTVATWSAGRPPTAEQIAEAQQWYDQDRAYWDEEGEEQLAECLAMQEADPDPAADYGCEYLEPVLANYLPQVTTLFVDPASQEPMVTAETPGAAEVNAVYQSVLNLPSGVATVVALLTPLLFAALLIAVSFMTSELSTGSIGLWLTFEPRRTRVFWSKVAAAAIGSGVVVLAGMTLVAAGVVAGHLVHGSVGTAPDGMTADLVAFVGRAAAAGIAAGVAGLALGALFKHAAAGIGVAAVWLGAEGMFRWQLGEAQRWLYSTNLTAWLRGGEVFTTERCTPSEDTGLIACEQVFHVVSPLQGGLVVGGVAVGLACLAWVVFRRRDVA